MDKTMKQLAWEAIQALGTQIQQTDPTLTGAQARLKAVETSQGKELLALYRDPDSRLSVSDWRAKHQDKQALQALGYTSWDQAVAKLAKAVAGAQGKDFGDGLAFVRKNCPNVMKAYQQERSLGGR